MAKKNSNGDGTIYNNGKYWVGQVTIGRDPETGKIKRKSIYGKTRREVKDKLTATIFELNNESFVEPSSMLVKDWADYWLKNFKKPNISESTYVKLQSLVKTHIIKNLGSVRIKDLNVFQIQTMLNDLQNRELSDGFIQRVYTYTNGMLKKALDVELIKKNPCSSVVIPKKGNKKKITALTREEQAALVDICKKYQNGELYIFLIGTGLRIGEALALSWDNINFDTGVINVKGTIIELNGRAKINDKTKTPAGVRSIYMSDTIKTMLLKIHNEQDLKANNLKLIFPSKNYTINLSANVRIRFKRYLKQAGVRDINIHALRHTFATRALEKGINIKVLSKILGHNDIRVTLNTYSHVLDEFEKDSMKDIDIFL